MNYLTPLPFLLLATTTLSAQITVTNATFPAAGDTLRLAHATNPEIAVSVYTPPGGGQTWDLNGLQTGVTEEIIFKPADQGSVGAQVPGAELFAALPLTAEAYYNVTSTKFELQAYYGTVPYDIVANHVFDYTPLWTERYAPMNFFDIGATSSNILEKFVPADFSPLLMINLAAQTNNAQIDSMRYRTALNRIDVVDAYGSMSIPGGTYEVLREKSTRYSQTRIDGKVPPLGWLDITSEAIQAGFNGLEVDTITQFRFYNDIAKEPIAVVTFNSRQDAVTNVVFKNNLIVSSTSDVDAPDPSITISPNPAADEATISFKDFAPGPYHLVMADARGQIIQEKTVQVSDNTLEQLNLSRLSPGMYVVTLYDQYQRMMCRGKVVKVGS
ncbi:MAG: T9SS type A sorting domain-containing protein [Saprospiraceae bacterium]|nr:T9SS type A sorting domain-containing protein [Candidatus Opimibacter iunctus]